MATLSRHWQTVKNIIWLALGVGCLLLTFIFWIVQNKPKTVEIAQQQKQQQDVDRPVQIEKVAVNQNLGTFTDEVPPFNLTQRSVEVSSHEAEFRGAKFVADYHKKWTLQLMKVSEEDIIRAYLAKREDRKKFNYLRLQDGKNPEQYVLIYGQYDSAQQAVEQSQKVNFELPESVKVLPESLSTYSALVRDLGSEEVLSGTKLRNIVLTKTVIPRIVAPEPTVTPSSLAGSADQSATKTEQMVKTQNAATSPVKTGQIEQKITEPVKPHTNEEQIIDPF
ncbi:hypothetical protein F4V57_08725 [Acinetobacter qingfengensis]|uniref:SPOR domain-containing protein n=1 Tax=Acinetobacter qingfengensis TaxID=1262585 RepID=A0A1E7R177_9GAMM|nr:hypothetical protein [Acinetobacter qingfengensis]KAA8733298.1 hypothetical protein F4V57_08725 [Acinetobacter qingfengensis]OEY93070.1 hypothetical protein BJI46_04835 [Acinetobacter qingfengensis]